MTSTKDRLIHLVDDDDAIRQSASFMLRHAGYRVQTYADGAEFIAADIDEHGAAVLLDYQMPRLDGLGVMDALAERKSVLPVIMLTAHGDIAVAVSAMKKGAVDFLEKPFEKHAILDALGRAFSRAETEGEGRLRKEAAEHRLSVLTQREREVLARLARGDTNKMVAANLGISPRTAEVHRANLMEKLEASSLSAALRVAFAAELGFDDQ